MADTLPPDEATREILHQLADIAMPAPVSFMPQTWGWAGLTTIATGLLAWICWHLWRHHAAQRYRHEALAELDRLELLLASESSPGTALSSMAELLKRVVLAAWPRKEVAALSGKAWVDFLHAHAGNAPFDEAAARFFDDLEYRSNPATMNKADSIAVAKAIRGFIENHRVSA